MEIVHALLCTENIFTGWSNYFVFIANKSKVFCFKMNSPIVQCSAGLCLPCTVQLPCHCPACAIRRVKRSALCLFGGCGAQQSQGRLLIFLFIIQKLAHILMKP